MERTKIEEIRRQINDLEKIAEDVEQLAKKLFQDVPIKESVENCLASAPSSFTRKRLFPPFPSETSNGETYRSYSWGILNDELKQVQNKTIRQYERYYSTAYQFVKEYLPERETEFVDCYYKTNIYADGVLACLQLHTTLYKGDKSLTLNRFKEKFEIQRSILLSLPDVLEVKRLATEKTLQQDDIGNDVTSLKARGSNSQSKERLQELYGLLSDKVHELRRSRIIETDPAKRFQLKKLIEENEEELEQIDQELEKLEKREEHT